MSKKQERIQIQQKEETADTKAYITPPSPVSPPPLFSHKETVDSRVVSHVSTVILQIHLAGGFVLEGHSACWAAGRIVFSFQRPLAR